MPSTCLKPVKNSTSNLIQPSDFTEVIKKIKIIQMMKKTLRNMSIIHNLKGDIEKPLESGCILKILMMKYERREKLIFK